MNKRIILITANVNNRKPVTEKWMRDITESVKQETLYALAKHLEDYYASEQPLSESVIRYMKEDVAEYSKSIGMKIRLLERGNRSKFVLSHGSGENVLSTQFNVYKYK